MVTTASDAIFSARCANYSTSRASLTLSPRELAQVYADVVSRGGRLLLNVGPDADGRIPEVQRRTLEGIATWMQALKPLTADRRTLTPDEVTVRGADEALWWRCWWHGERLVIVTDGAGIEVAADYADDATIVSYPGSEHEVHRRIRGAASGLWVASHPAGVRIEGPDTGWSRKPGRSF